MMRDVPVVEFFMGEGVLGFEVDGLGDVVGGGGGGDFAPEEKLVGVGGFGDTNEGEL
jgi:hypothetical protein